MSPGIAQRSVFDAIADPTRRAILDLLLEGDQTVLAMLDRVCERLWVVSQSAFSQHLAVLRGAGLVTSRKAGRTRVYSLRAKRLGEVADWLSEYDVFWTQRFEQLGKYLERTGQPPTTERKR